MNQRWSYQVIDIKPDFWGRRNKPEQMQEMLNRHGAQGWELVAITSGNSLLPHRLLFKKPV